MTQCFYLVGIQYDESFFPKKIFLQEKQAIKWGRREATKLVKQNLSLATNCDFVLMKQEITAQGRLYKVKTLEPYENAESPKGADYDIDSPFDQQGRIKVRR